jgi:hypothetical protein
MPGKNAAWNNFSEVLYTFFALYCYYEGLLQSQTLTRQVLLYIFHGKYLHRKKDRAPQLYPIVHGIHFKTTFGRSRFAKHVALRFSKFIELSQGKPGWRLMLDDKGVADAPQEYMDAIEAGLRAYGEDKYAMGSAAMNSRETWGNVEIWRKREAYIALAWHIHRQPNIKRWQCFRWNDFILRSKLTTTFNARHAPLCHGGENDFPNLQDPPHWAAAKTVSKKRKKKSASSSASSSQREDPDTDDDPIVPLRYDPISGELVPF